MSFLYETIRHIIHDRMERKRSAKNKELNDMSKIGKKSTSRSPEKRAGITSNTIAKLNYERKRKRNIQKQEDGAVNIYTHMYGLSILLSEILKI